MVTAPPVHALLLGSGITVLGSLRALARERVEVWCGDTERGVEAFSRWYRHYPLSEDSPAAVAEWCRRTAGIKIVIPCSDHWIKIASGTGSDLRGSAFVTSAEEPILSMFIDKGEFSELTLRANVPAPRVYSVGGALPDGVRFEEGRWFLKPRHSQQFFGQFGVKAWWPQSAKEADSYLQMARTHGHAMVVQEFIPGPPDAHIYVEGYRRRDGVYDGIFARRRLRMYPSFFGNSTAMISIPCEEVGDAVLSVRRLLEAANYTGIFSAELKRDDSDGLWKVIEVNIRPWWYIEFAARCGVNVLAAVVREATGSTVPNEIRYRSGVRMVNLYTDWAEIRSRRGVTIADWAARIFGWARSSCTVFTLSDPLPGICWCVRTAWDAIRRRW